MLRVTLSLNSPLHCRKMQHKPAILHIPIKFQITLLPLNLLVNWINERISVYCPWALNRGMTALTTIYPAREEIQLSSTLLCLFWMLIKKNNLAFLTLKNKSVHKNRSLHLSYTMKRNNCKVDLRGRVLRLCSVEYVCRFVLKKWNTFLELQTTDFH